MTNKRDIVGYAVLSFIGHRKETDNKYKNRIKKEYKQEESCKLK